MNQRIVPWGTVIAGGIALVTALFVGLVEIAGVSIPVRSAGPGAVIVVGVLILLAGLVVVLRSGRAARAVATAAEPSTAAPSTAEPEHAEPEHAEPEHAEESAPSAQSSH